jgi:hypothetical protein
MSLVQIPIIQFLKQRIPDYQRLPRPEVWNRVESLRKRGDIRGLVPAEAGEAGIKLGPSKRERVFYGFVEIDHATSDPDAKAHRPAAPVLRMPKYSTAGAGGDEFFLSHLAMDVAAHFKEIEPEYRTRHDGQGALAQEVQRFVDHSIAAWRGVKPRSASSATKAPAASAAPKGSLSRKLAHVKALRKEGKDSYTPKGGPTYVRMLQGGSPQ